MEKNENQKKYEKRGFLFHENRKYHKKTKLSNGWRERCARTGCPATGKFLDNGEFVQKATEAHASWCEEDPNIEAFEELKRNYVMEVSTSFEKPRNVLNKHARQTKLKYPNMKALNYQKLKNPTTYARREVNPPQPKNLNAMGEYLQQEKYKKILHYNWKPSTHLSVEIVPVEDNQKNKSFSLIFGDREWSRYVFSHIEHTVQGFIDGTFPIKQGKMKVMQLLKFEVSCFAQGVPLVYVLMEKGKSINYEAVIRRIVEKFVPELADFPVKLYTDFEAAETKGWKAVLPETKFVYCSFHFDQIQWKNGRRLGMLKTLKRLRKENLSEIEKAEKEEENRTLDEIKDTLKLIFAMPLLPISMMADEALFDRMIARVSEKAKQKMSKYIKYFKNNWLSTRHPPEEWNVSEEIYRTNNFSESGNRLMNDFFQQKHPDPWPFVRTLTAYHGRVANEFQGRVGTINLGKKQLIDKYKGLLLAGHIQRLEFLIKVSEETCNNHDRVFMAQVDLAVEEEQKNGVREQDGEKEDRKAEDAEAEDEEVEDEEAEDEEVEDEEAEDEEAEDEEAGNRKEEEVQEQADAQEDVEITGEVTNDEAGIRNGTRGTKAQGEENSVDGELNGRKDVDVDDVKALKRSRNKILNSLNREGRATTIHDGVTDCMFFTEGQRYIDKRGEQHEESRPDGDSAKSMAETERNGKKAVDIDALRAPKRPRKQIFSLLNREGGEIEIQDGSTDCMFSAAGQGSIHGRREQDKENRFDGDSRKSMVETEQNGKEAVDIDASIAQKHPRKQIHGLLNREGGEIEMQDRGADCIFLEKMQKNDLKQLTAVRTPRQKRPRKQILEIINREGEEMEIETPNVRQSKSSNLKKRPVVRVLRM